MSANHLPNSPQENKATNFFILAGCQIMPFERIGHPCFELIMANGERRYMQAETKEERDAWIKSLREAATARRVSQMPPSLNHLEQPKSFGEDTNAPSTIDGRVEQQKLKPENFNFLKVLGKGNYGKVMLATLKGRPESELYAIKVIKKSGLIDEESLEHVLAENRVLQTLDHPFLVKLHYSFQTNDRLYFVMEYVHGKHIIVNVSCEWTYANSLSI